MVHPQPGNPGRQYSDNGLFWKPKTPPKGKVFQRFAASQTEGTLTAGGLPRGYRYEC